MPAEQQWILDARRAVGDRVRVQRLHLNLTQELQRIEYGGEAKLSHLLLIARELRIHVRDLLS